MYQNICSQDHKTRKLDSSEIWLQIEVQELSPSFDFRGLLDGESRTERVQQTDKLFGSSIHSSQIVD